MTQYPWLCAGPVLLRISAQQLSLRRTQEERVARTQEAAGGAGSQNSGSGRRRDPALAKGPSS